MVGLGGGGERGCGACWTAAWMATPCGARSAPVPVLFFLLAQHAALPCRPRQHASMQQLAHLAGTQANHAASRRQQPHRQAVLVQNCRQQGAAAAGVLRHRQSVSGLEVVTAGGMGRGRAPALGGRARHLTARSGKVLSGHHAACGGACVARHAAHVVCTAYEAHPRSTCRPAVSSASLCAAASSAAAWPRRSTQASDVVMHAAREGRTLDTKKKARRWQRRRSGQLRRTLLAAPPAPHTWLVARLTAKRLRRQQERAAGVYTQIHGARCVNTARQPERWQAGTNRLPVVGRM